MEQKEKGRKKYQNVRRAVLDIPKPLVPPTEERNEEESLEQMLPPPNEVETSGMILNFDTYEGLIAEMENVKIRYQSKSSSVTSLTNYCSTIETKKKGRADQSTLLWDYLASHINDPSPTAEDMNKLTELTGFDKSKINYFFKNQRKRYLIPISESLDRDFNVLFERVADNEETIDSYMRKISGQ